MLRYKEYGFNQKVKEKYERVWIKFQFCKANSDTLQRHSKHEIKENKKDSALIFITDHNSSC
jgi:hypothetical protein